MKTKKGAQFKMTALELPTDLIIHSGSHEPESGQHCILNCAAYYAPACGFEEKRSDLPWDDHQSICRVVRSFAIAVNDSGWSSDEVRTAALKPIVCSVLGTERGPDAAQKRWYCLANHAFRWAVEALRHSEMQKQADDLALWIGKIVDSESARAAARAAAYAARAAADAAAYAAYAADAAADAAAYAAARAAAYAARAAADAAAYAAYAAADAAGRDKYLKEAAEVLLEICLIT